MILELNNFDVLVFCGIIISTATGLIKGFTRSILWLGGGLASMYVILNFRISVAQELSNYIKYAWAADIIAVIAILFFTMLVATILGKFIKSLLGFVGLGIFDHILGLIFGFLRGLFFILLLLHFSIKSTAVTKSLQIKESKSWPTLRNMINQPKDWQQQIPNLSNLKTYWHTQLDHFVSLNNMHVPKHRR